MSNVNDQRVGETAERIIDRVCLMSDLSDVDINGDQSFRSYLQDELRRLIEDVR